MLRQVEVIEGRRWRPVWSDADCALWFFPRTVISLWSNEGGLTVISALRRQGVEFVGVVCWDAGPLMGSMPAAVVDHVMDDGFVASEWTHGGFEQDGTTFGFGRTFVVFAWGYFVGGASRDSFFGLPPSCGGIRAFLWVEFECVGVSRFLEN